MNNAKISPLLKKELQDSSKLIEKFTNHFLKATTQNRINITIAIDLPLKVEVRLDKKPIQYVHLSGGEKYRVKAALDEGVRVAMAVQIAKTVDPKACGLSREQLYRISAGKSIPSAMSVVKLLGTRSKVDIYGRPFDVTLDSNHDESF